MKTLTRRSAARQIKVTSNHLIYWENQGNLRPEKVKVGNTTLVVYTPELIQKAKKIFARDNRKKRGKK